MYRKLSKVQTFYTVQKKEDHLSSIYTANHSHSYSGQVPIIQCGNTTYFVHTPYTYYTSIKCYFSNVKNVNGALLNTVDVGYLIRAVAIFTHIPLECLAWDQVIPTFENNIIELDTSKKETKVYLRPVEKISKKLR